MRAPASLLAATLLGSLLTAPVLAQETVLQNDGFVDGQAIGFQGGFVAGEMAGSRFLPAGTGPWRVNRVLFLLGGSSATVTVTVRIYDDAAGTNAPGSELFSGDYSVSGSDVAMQEVDLTAANVIVPGQFRVAILFQHSGFPSVARDGDGTINTTRNFIFAPSIPGWFPSNLFGLTGDWIIRAGVEPTGGGGGTPGLPDILSITDVGGDQGRQVRLRFARASQDSAGAATPVLGYDVHRMVNPLALLAGTGARPASPFAVALDGWDYVATVPAHGDAIYSIVVPTLVDSSIANGMRRSVFIVRAATAAPTTFFDSPADSGYSVDNLPPLPPAAAPAQYVSGATRLTWSPNGEADLWYYAVHRGASAAFTPSPANRIATTQALAHDDPGAPGSWYKLAAVDVNGNIGAYTLVAPATTDAPATTRLALSLAFAGPHPASGALLRFTVTLPTGDAARLELLDVLGRRIATRELGVLGAGRHAVELPRPDATGAGVLLARLTQGGADRVVRVIVMK